MRILAFHDETDLRTVTHHRAFLQATAKAHGLEQYGDAVIFNGKSADRYRMVVHMGSGPMLVMPETEMDKRVSRYLRVSIQLAELTVEPGVREWFKSRIHHAETRLERSKKRAERAKAAKKNRLQGKK